MMDYDDAMRMREHIKAERDRLYREDRSLRWICDSAVRDAMDGYEPERDNAEDVHNRAATAVMTALAMAMTKDAEFNFLVRERDSLRELVNKISHLPPGIPIYASKDATEQFLKPTPSEA